MNKSILFLLLFLAVNIAYAQSSIVKQSIAFISTQKWTSAKLYLDSILAQSPKEVDAIMMQGNIVLNKHLIEKQQQPTITALDEDIFTDKAPYAAAPPPIIDLKQADSIETFWRRALSIDPQRVDIQMGLCMLFGMSLQEEKLLKQLVVFKKNSGNDERAIISMIDYARLFRERGRFKQTNNILAEVATLYPASSLVKSDWAGESMFMGDLTKANQLAKDILKLRQYDYTTLQNITSIFCAANNPIDALIAQKQYAKVDSFYHYAELYETLLQFGGDEEIWHDRMSLQLQRPVFEADTNELVQLSQYLVSSGFNNQYDNYMAILSVPLSTLSTWTILQKSTQLFPDSAQLRLMLAEYFLNGKNYSLANTHFAKAISLPLDPALKEDAKFIYAYSLYQAGKMPEASIYFKIFLQDQNNFKKQAATYFFAKINRRKDMLDTLIKVDSPTKYSTLAKIYRATLP
jgi:tetratricopeptide (TPR) repeat protein